MTRIALITGAGSGLGFKIAQSFAETGMTVVLSDLNEKAAADSAAALPKGKHGHFACDVAKEADVEDLFNQVEEKWGPVTVLMNSAGILRASPDGTKPTIVDTEVGEWDKIMAVNARGHFLTIRTMLRRRAKLPVQQGRIINMASSAAQLGGYNGSSAYISSKGAILSLTKIAAREAAPLGITVNAIAPGAIDTPMLRSVMPRERDEAYAEKVPMARIGLPDDVAAAAVYLASPGASYVTGACIDVNGGMRMQ